jgi:hypothetical protein
MVAPKVDLRRDRLFVPASFIDIEFIVHLRQQERMDLVHVGLF